MTDIFFSYSSADRERVRPVRDALAEQGFEVFWDQQVPTGIDWDNWIRQHLTKSKCVMAFWSATSVSSDNVRHEATVAKQKGKLISVLLEPLTAEQFPMGLYAQQAANLSGWSGDSGHQEWRKFRREFEAKLTPLWVRRQIDELEAELVGERARREGAERRDRVLQAQIVKEAEAQQDLKRDRDKALDEVAALKTNVEELTQARADAKAKQAEAQQASTLERNKALAEVATLKTTVEELTRARADSNAQVVDLSQRLRNVRKSKAQEIARSIGAALSPLVLAAAVATVGFWTYQLFWSMPRPPLAVTSEMPEAERQRLAAIKEEEQRQAKADVEAKLKAAEAEQQQLKEEAQRQTKAAADAEVKRKAAEVEQQRLKEEAQRQTKAAADAEAKRKSAEERLAAILKFEQGRADAEAATKKPDIKLAPATSPASAQSPTGLFAIKADTEASGNPGPAADLPLTSFSSRAACEQSCAEMPSCNAFTYKKSDGTCFRYSSASSFNPNKMWDSGVRTEQVSPTGLFIIKADTEALGSASGSVSSSTGSTTRTDCEKSCAREPGCNAFTYDKNSGQCYRFSGAFSLTANTTYESGVRK
jgi:hypothetical protein